MTDTLEQFPSVYCDNCRKVRPMIFDVLVALQHTDVVVKSDP
jgi:hypothetical protein